MNYFAVCLLFKEYNSRCFNEDVFTLEPDIVKKFTFSFPAFPRTVGGSIEVIKEALVTAHIHHWGKHCVHIIQIHTVQVLLQGRNDGGTDSAFCCPTLIWSNGASECFLSKPSDLLWQKVELQNVTK